MDERLKTPKNCHIYTVFKPDQKEVAPFTERMRGQEQTGLNTLYGCLLFLSDGQKKLEKRMEKLGLLWRVKGLRSQLEKIIHKVEASADPAQRATLAIRGLHTSGYIGIEKVNNDPQATYILIDDLNVICRTVLDDTCSFCTKKGKEAANCPLQRALKACTTLDDKTVIDGCMCRPYSDAGRLGLLDEGEDLIV